MTHDTEWADRSNIRYHWRRRTARPCPLNVGENGVDDFLGQRKPFLAPDSNDDGRHQSVALAQIPDEWCGKRPVARTVSVPWNTDADALKPAASVSTSKPAVLAQSPYYANRRTTSAIVGAA
ncbi:hypothetical protein J4T90_06760 [Sinorhizobium medicae]|uniref:hypothetical protein n=1 Tax=Sinorhizobium medicae TaxID=110321 RepID=UPI0030800AE5